MTARILVADDEPDIRLMVRMVLQREGHDVDEFEDGAAAVDAVDVRDYDLAVLDQKMPKLTGIETARKLRRHGHSLPIVIFSAYLDERVESESSQMGLTTLSKGDVQKLAPVIDRLLSEADLTR